MANTSTSTESYPSYTPTATQVPIDVYVFTDIPYYEWLIVGIVLACLIIVGVIITVIVNMCKKKDTKVYAEQDSPSDDNDAGNAKVLNVYRLKGTED